MLVHDDNPSQSVLIAFSPQDDAVDNAVLPLLKSANQSIDIAMFFLTHKTLTKELVNAHKRGVKVRIILDATGAANGYSKHQYLREHGIAIKIENWGGKMHMKSALIDNRHLIIGSMNWTSAGASKNDENTIVINNFSQAKKFRNFFEKLWLSIDNKWLNGLPQAESLESFGSCSDGIDNDFDHQVDSKDKGCIAYYSNS